MRTCMIASLSTTVCFQAQPQITPSSEIKKKTQSNHRILMTVALPLNRKRLGAQSKQSSICCFCYRCSNCGVTSGLHRHDPSLLWTHCAPPQHAHQRWCPDLVLGESGCHRRSLALGRGSGACKNWDTVPTAENRGNGLGNSWRW